MEPATRPSTMPVRLYTIDQFMLTVRMSGLFFSHDEREILVTSNHTGVSNAYSIPIASGPSRQLTFSKDESIRAVSYFPQDRRILYVRDKGGIENRHLCVGETDDSEIELTQGERVKTGFYGWSADGCYFYCTTDERTHTYLDLYRVDARTYERRLIFYNEDGYIVAMVSPDGNYVALIRPQNFANSDLYLYHLGPNTLDLVTPHTGDAYYMPLYFDSSCQNLYYRAMQSEDEVIEYQYNLKTRVPEECERRPANFRQIVISESRRYRAVISDERESSTISLLDYSTNTALPLGPLPEGNVTSAAISKSDRWLAFYVNGDRNPTELYVYDLWSNQLSRLTNNVNPAINREDLVESEVVSFESFDGMKIPGLLWKPHDASRRHKVPGLVWVHGGPMGQIRKGYAGAVQFLVNHGYAVFGVNHRGSTGYGRAFMNAADGKQGREPLWDCVEAKRYLATLDYIDPDRIGIIGGSFGAYMALAALTLHPEEFEVGIAICGVSNLVRHIEDKLKQPHTARIYLQKIGHPVKDRIMLESVSPAFHAERITKPLMVLHGAKDPRASKVESDDIVNAVRANGGLVEYLEFDDEAHGFRKRANSVRAYQAILTFLDTHLSTHTLCGVMKTPSLHFANDVG
jgi:dipeptidyl aminopeptidase/acylaminoacyl peptidase